MRICKSCGKKMHNFQKEKALLCVPPKNVLTFGDYHINKDYRDDLFQAHPNYTVEEILRTFLGMNGNFKGYDEWLKEREYLSDSEDSESESDSDINVYNKWHEDITIIGMPVFIK